MSDERGRLLPFPGSDDRDGALTEAEMHKVMLGVLRVRKRDGRDGATTEELTAAVNWAGESKFRGAIWQMILADQIVLDVNEKGSVVMVLTETLED